MWGAGPAKAGEAPNVKKIVEDLVTDYAAYCRQVAAGTDEAARFLARLKG